MRLLDIYDLTFQVFADESARPNYVIFSHRWQTNEPFLQDILDGRRDDTTLKLYGFVEYVKRHFPHIHWVWVDSCCIKQDDSVERSESVNLMFDWYSRSEVCIAYLADVDDPLDRLALCGSVWFRRGWTLQEMLASKVLIFVTSGWQVIGHKGRREYVPSDLPVGPNIELILSIVTNVPEAVLHDFHNSQALSTEQKLNWMRGRQTTKQEDMFYAMFGIFDVAPGVNYGEKRAGARKRLLDAIAAKDLRPAVQREELLRMSRQALECEKYGRWQEAIDLIRYVVDQGRSLCNDDLELRINPILHLGHLYYKRSRRQEAFDLFDEAHAVLEQVLGPIHTTVLHRLAHLSETQWHPGCYQASESLLQQIHTTLRSREGASHPDTLQIKAMLGRIRLVISFADTR